MAIKQDIDLRILKRARAKIADGKNWRRNALAYDDSGRTTSVVSSDAVSFCALGSIARAAYELAQESERILPENEVHEIMRCIKRKIPGGESIVRINDGPQGLPGVLKIFDRAIAQQEKPLRSKIAWLLRRT